MNDQYQIDDDWIEYSWEVRRKARHGNDDRILQRRTQKSSNRLTPFILKG